MSDAEETGSKQYAWLAPHSWKPGQSGNPKGRPKGARSKLEECFIRDFYEAWQALGKPALQNMARKHPEKFVQVAASLVPKELKITDLTEDELRDRIRELCAELGLGIAELAGGIEAPTEDQRIN